MIQLTDNENYYLTPQINDSGEVVWYGNDGIFYQIFLAIPTVDSDDGGEDSFGNIG